MVLNVGSTLAINKSLSVIINIIIIHSTRTFQSLQRKKSTPKRTQKGDLAFVVAFLKKVVFTSRSLSQKYNYL